jgi:Ca2+-binding EF-hand superfamily protein
MFRFLDKENKGYISGEQFEELIKHFGTFRMPKGIQQRLSKIKSVNEDNVVSFHYWCEISQSNNVFIVIGCDIWRVYCTQWISESPASHFTCGEICMQQERSTHQQRFDSLSSSMHWVTSSDEFKQAAMKMLANNMSPLECNVIFTIFDTNRDGRISHEDVTCVTHYGRSCVSKQELLNALGTVKKRETDKGGMLNLAFETVAHFGLGNFSFCFLFIQ